MKMFNSFFTFFFEKQYRVAILLNLLFAVLLFSYLNFMGDITSKYIVYLFVAPFFLFILFKIDKAYIKIAAPIFVLIFVENIVISRVPVSKFFKIGITLIFGLTVLFSLLWHKKKYMLPKYTSLFWAVFFISAFISLIIGSVKGNAYLYANISNLITYYFGFLLFFYIGYQSLERPEDVNKIILIIFLFGAITAAGHIFSITTGINLELIRGSEMVSASRDLSEGNWRYGGFFGNVNSMSAFYVMLIPGGFVLLFNNNNTFIKVFSVVTILLMLVSTLIGASRGAILFIAANILVSIFFLKLNLKQFIYGFVLVAILAVAADIILDNYLQEFFQRALDEIARKGTDSPRELIWHYTFMIIRDHPFGVGLTWYNFTPLLMKYGNISWANPHSVYFQMLVQNGYLGFAAFLAIIGQVLVLNIKAYKKSIQSMAKNSLAFIFLMITGFMLMGLTEPIFRNQYKLNYILGIALGMSLSYSFRIIYSNKKNNYTNGESIDEAIV